jgi:hypothetical protein
VCVCVCVCIRMWPHWDEYIRIYIRMYIRVYTYIHTYISEYVHVQTVPLEERKLFHSFLKKITTKPILVQNGETKYKMGDTFRHFVLEGFSVNLQTKQNLSRLRLGKRNRLCV